MISNTVLMWEVPEHIAPTSRLAVYSSAPLPSKCGPACGTGLAMQSLTKQQFSGDGTGSGLESSLARHGLRLRLQAPSANLQTTACNTKSVCLRQKARPLSSYHVTWRYEHEIVTSWTKTKGLEIATHPLIIGNMLRLTMSPLTKGLVVTELWAPSVFIPPWTQDQARVTDKNGNLR